MFPLLILTVLANGSPPASVAAPSAALLRAPLAFEAVDGAAAERGDGFVARGDGYALSITRDGVALALREATLRMRFFDTRRVVHVAGLDPLPSRSNYFIGRDPARWRTGVPHFARVRYDGVSPGVDAVFYGNQRALEYDLVVAPGADPSRIVLAFTGAEHIRIDADGALVLHTSGGDVVQRKPVVYQDVDGEQRAVAGAFVPRGRHGGEQHVGFRIGAYDRSRPLVIDPVLSYATYLGGNPDNDGRAIAADANGNAYVTGYTRSATFPRVGGLPAPNNALQGDRDVFVAKFDSSGVLVYSTYLGGNGNTAREQGNAIAVDGDGNVYVTGETDSTNFPTVNPLPPPNDAAQGDDAFVTKLGPNGDTIVYSTYLGGTSSSDIGRAIAVDATHNAYVAGSTFSDDFPTAGTLANNVLHGVIDAFVTKLATNGSSLVYSIFLGGSGADQAFGIAVRNSEAYVTGRTQSSDFPLMSGLPAPNNSLRGFSDGFATKINTTGNGIVYSTYLSGSSDIDDGNAIAVDGDGNAYIGGKTESNNLLHTTATSGSLPAPNAAFRGGADGFVAKLGTTGNSVTFLAFLGGSGNGDDDEVNGIAVDANHDIYVIGRTDSNDFPVVNGLPLQNRIGSSNDAAIVTKLAAAGNALVYSSYLGGTGEEVGRGIALDGMGHAFVVGQTMSSDFPTVNAAQPTRGSAQFSGGDAFVARIDDAAPAGAPYTVGHVFISVPDFGEVRQFTPTGTLVRALSLPSGTFTQGTNAAGLAFDDTGNLYVADITQKAVFEFDTNGVFAGTFASGITDGPQSLVFDVAGNLYVGTFGGNSNVQKLSSTGMPLMQFDVFVHGGAAMWVDLAADQKTLFYTSNIEDVARFDVAANAQIPDDFHVGILRDFGVRILPGGSILVAESDAVLRVNSNDMVTKTYLPNTTGNVFQVSRDPDGQTFWAATNGEGSSESGRLFNVDIATGNVPHQFTGATASFSTAIGGLAVFGELTEARSGGPAPTPTGPTATPSPTPTRTPAPETDRCDDCIDNDFDGDVDRDDSECPPRADGTELGLDPAGPGKALVKCAKALGNVGAKLAAARLKHLQKCVNAAFACVQVKPNDAGCPVKAGSTCGKEIGKLPADESKARAKIVKACAPPAIAPSDLRIAAGLGFDAEASICADRGVAMLTSAADVASCVVAEHACRVDDLLGIEAPRAAELLQLAGRNPAVEFPCLAAGGGAGDVGAAKAKLAAKCQQAIGKASLKFTSTKAKLVQKCAGAAFLCLEQKPLDAKCRPKAGTTCAKQLAKLTDPTKGAAAKLTASITKSCSKAPLGLADVLGNAGLDFAARSGECAALGVPSLATFAAVSDCVERRHACRVEQMLETELPRLVELLDTGGVTLP